MDGSMMMDSPGGARGSTIRKRGVGSSDVSAPSDGDSIIKKFDIYGKVHDDYNNKTKSGGTLSLVLFVLELVVLFLHLFFCKINVSSSHFDKVFLRLVVIPCSDQYYITLSTTCSLPKLYSLLKMKRKVQKSTLYLKIKTDNVPVDSSFGVW